MEVVKGQRRTTTRKFFPGYMFVQMVLDDRTFHLVKNTPKITGFLGGTKPTPVPEPDHRRADEHDRGQGQAEGPRRVRGRRYGPRRRRSVRQLLGDDRRGQGDKQKVKVLLSMFGRATSVELDFAQVEKA